MERLQRSTLSITERGLSMAAGSYAWMPVSCVNGIYEPELAKYLIENELVDTVDLGKAILADPAFCEAVLNGTPFVKCFGCPNCQYGPGMPHKCPAETKRSRK
nr:hypothetical protein [Butyrivibrio sp. ob235]